ncbi:MAG: M4 family metallopeptidase [Saprospiraceae bacterium]|nr:M4 family metallopeptidase [Saprospiraceae bacterium]
MCRRKFEDFFFVREILCLLVFGCLLCPQFSWAQVDNERLATFAVNTQASISYHKSTGRPNFIRFPAQVGLKIAEASATEKCRSFMHAHGDVFGISDADKELMLIDEGIDKYGAQHIIYQQYHQGVPVFDGQLKFHFDAAGSLTVVNGVIIPDIKISTAPSLTSDRVQKIAEEELRQQDPGIRSWLNRPAKLYIYRGGILSGTAGTNHLIYQLELNDGVDIREFFFIDAHTGEVIDQISGIHGALFRRLYEVNTTNQIWTEGDGFPGGLDQWQQNEIAAAGQTYYFFHHAFGYDSYDGSGAEMRTINNSPNINCPNANWNGSTVNYCTGTASDDIVGHEWAHAYTEYTSGLIYAWQSGALNESYSDIWGETIDLLNAYEDQGEDLAQRSSCGSSDRWRMGEDASALGGAIRDMWDPTCNGDPGKVSDTEYWCSVTDQGGVHTNSGVHNHAYALLVDGGNYNGYTIAGLGFTKAAHIFWRAQHIYLTATSDFEVQADALEAACTDLIGVDLEGLSTTEAATGPSGEMIDVDDLVELQKVIAAVELRMAPPCAFDPLLAASSPCVWELPKIQRSFTKILSLD